MTRASIWLIRFSLSCLTAGTILGAWMLAARGSTLPPPGAWAFPVHVELLLFGWVVQLVFGVGHWILPRLPGAARDAGVARVWIAMLALNAGIALVALAALGVPGSELPGRLLEFAAVAIFAVHAARRVRPYQLKPPGPTPA